MRPPVLVLTALLCTCAITSGCATIRYPTSYRIEGKEAKEFKDLDDEKALKLVVAIYNVKYEDWEDGIARSIALQEYIGMLGKRKSAYLKDSGVFEMQYDKVKLPSWNDDDLMKLYDSLEPKARPYYLDASAELTEVQNTARIMFLTAESVVAAEMKKRNMRHTTLAVATQVLVGVLTMALSLI